MNKINRYQKYVTEATGLVNKSKFTAKKGNDSIVMTHTSTGGIDITISNGDKSTTYRIDTLENKEFKEWNS